MTKKDSEKERKRKRNRGRKRERRKEEIREWKENGDDEKSPSRVTWK